MDSIEIKVPGLAGVVLKRRGPSSYKPPVVEEPKKATRKRASSVKPKTAAAKKAPAKTKATKSAAKLRPSPPRPRRQPPRRPLPRLRQVLAKHLARMRNKAVTAVITRLAEA